MYIKQQQPHPVKLFNLREKFISKTQNQGYSFTIVQKIWNLQVVCGMDKINDREKITAELS